MRVVWTLEEWASAISDVPVDPLLPARTVFVPNERAAHALRRTLVRQGAGQVLIGTRFVTLLQFARELLHAAGEVPLVNDRELGPALAQRAFASVSQRSFRREDLLELPGWDDAFVRAIADLDAACVSPDSLIASDDAQVHDVGLVHAALRQGGGFGTVGGLLQRAAAVSGGPANGPLLALATGFESAAEVQLLRAQPGLTWVLWGVRPVRREHLTRTASLLGDEFAQALAAPRPQPRAAGALARVQATLFAEPLRDVAEGGDDSVRVAIYAGVHEEVEAAVGWVVEQLVEHALPAQEIAILSATAEPYGSLLRARLAALPWPEPREAAFSERGLPLSERADGTRVLAAIRALAGGLSRESLAPLLPILRGSDPERKVRGLSRSWELLNMVACAGGTPRHLEAGCAWGDAIRTALGQLQPAAESGVELDPIAARERAAQAEAARDLAALLPAIDALTEVLRSVIADAPLSEIWLRFSALTHQLRLPIAVPPATALLDAAVWQLAELERFEPRGLAVLDWLDATLCEASARSGRFGMPALYIGTLAGAQGLSFAAVRVVGLIEGSVPSAAREDPVLPDAARAQLSPLLPTSRLRAHRQLCRFDSALRSARERLVLTAPRVSLEGSTRQPAAVLLDVMRALAGADSERRLERQLEEAATAGRASERRFRARLPLSASAGLERIARRDLTPLLADHDPALALERLRALRERGEPDEQDGLLGGELPLDRLAGLSADRPISASRLVTLLMCPHRYLLEQVLYFREAHERIPTHLLEPMTFGTWLHGIAEEFWREHGAQIGQPARLATQRKDLRALARKRFAELAASYPFANPQVQTAQCEALCDQLDKLLRLDCEVRDRSFVAVERGFGYDEPCRLETASGPLYLRGKIDKLDRAGRTLLVRDIKTGAGKPRRANEPPDPGIDLQLGVYALVAQQLAAAWGTPREVGVAYLYLRGGEPERSWTGADYPQLEAATKDWLAIALETLKAGAFVRSPLEKDCQYCPYQPVCGPDMARAEGVLDDARVPRRLAVLKGGGAAEDAS